MTKKLFVLNGLILFVLCSVAFAEDRRPDPSSLVVMTLNGEFLWDGIFPEEGGAEFPWKHSQTEAEEHMKDIATLIIQHNPEMVNLVEVENLSALERLNEKFLAGRGYKAYFTLNMT